MRGPEIRLASGELAVVGYGSLMSARSVSRSLGRPYGGPFETCYLEGWRRSWDVWMPNQAYYYLEGDRHVYPEKILYLNVRRQPEARLNGVVLVLEGDEIEDMHAREWIYHPTVVTGDLRGVRVVGGEAITYVARETHRMTEAESPRQAAVRASYLRLLDDALQGAPAAFRADYERSTDPAPQHLVVNDVLDPERPNPWSRPPR